MNRFAGMLAVAGVLMLMSSTASAQGFGGSGYGNYSGSRGYSYQGRGQYGAGYRGRPSGPIYHGPSVHYDRVYHPEYQHWTPNRGWHTHGHYDLVPHYTPGHFDTKHRGHVHGNPHYHH